MRYKVIPESALEKWGLLKQYFADNPEQLSEMEIYELSDNYMLGSIQITTNFVEVPKDLQEIIKRLNKAIQDKKDESTT